MSIIEKRPVYQFGFFVPHGVTPNPKVIANLSAKFREFEFLPTTVQILNFGPGAPSQGLQLQLFTQDNRWKLDFEQNRFLITQNATDSADLDPPQVFVTNVIEIINHLYSLFNYNASRMSFVTRGLSKEMKEKELSIVHSRLFRLPAFFDDASFAEWSTRQVIRINQPIGDTPELLNIVTDISNVQDLFSAGKDSKPIDKIQIVMDINTFQGNRAQRFTPDHVGPFLNRAMMLADNIEKDIEDLIYE